MSTNLEDGTAIYNLFISFFVRLVASDIDLDLLTSKHCYSLQKQSNRLQIKYLLIYI